MSEMKHHKFKYFKISSEDNFTIILSLIVLTAICTLTYGLYRYEKFQTECETPLNQAEAASTIQIASKQMVLIIDGCQEYATDRSFFQQNEQQQLELLQRTSSTATTESKYLVMKQFKENIQAIRKTIHD
jgi:uncharacterized ion transporter superfamily protein YfcC